MPYFTKIIFLLLIVGNTLAAQHLSGIFQPSEADLEYVEQVDWTTFLAEDVRLNAKGFRLTNLETTGIGADRRYWGIFTESTLRDTLVKTTSWADFVQAKRSMAAAGFILSGVQAYALSETDAHYIGVWYRDETNTPHKIWKLDTPESVREKTDDMANQQYYLQDVEVFLTPGGTANYLAIYHYSPIPIRNYVYIASDENTFYKDLWQRYQSKIRLVGLEDYTGKDGSYLLGIYQPGTYDSQVVLNQTRADFNGKWEQLEKGKLKLVSWEIRD